MIETKKAFQMMPYMARILKKIDFKEFFKSVDKEQDEESAGMDFFLFLMENAAKCTNDIISVVALLDDKDFEEVEKQDMFDTFATLNTVFRDEKLMAFFQSAMR